MPDQSPRATRDQQSVLVVEDDSAICGVLTDLLHDAGYAVVQASDGREALQHLRQAEPDLVVLDLMMPRMSGWQLLERCRDQLDRADIPVVVVSVIDGRGDYPSSLGVTQWLTKPIDADRFLRAVELLANQRVSRMAGDGGDWRMIVAKPYRQYRHRRTGLSFRFAYDDADPELLHIYARHLTTPEDAIRTFFTGHTEWDAAHARFATRSETHTLTWFWVVPDRVVQVLTCMPEA